MIEVLIAMVIFAVGILGLVGLQARTIAAGQAALLRSQATMLTDDILDRMRANRPVAQANTYNTALASDSTAYSSTGTVAQRDLNAWKLQIETLLPAGKGAVARDGGGLNFIITIEWDDSRGRDPAQQFQTVTRL